MADGDPDGGVQIGDGTDGDITGDGGSADGNDRTILLVVTATLNQLMMVNSRLSLLKRYQNFFPSVRLAKRMALTIYVQEF